MSNSIRVYQSDEFNYTYQCDTKTGFGPNKFVDRDTVLADLKKTDDILTLDIKITLSNGSDQGTNYFNLQEDFGLLLKTKENSDIILVSSDKKKHKAHKAILACRSKVFSAMFKHNMKESQDNVVKIEDVDDETLKAMLHFMYTGELVKTMKDVPKKLLIAADKYDELNDLKRMCINYLHTNMNFDNVLDLIQFGDTYSMNELKLKAKKYFFRNREEILSANRRKKLQNLSRGIVEDLLCDLACTKS